MNAYRQYWLLTALLLSAAIYGAYAGVISWTIETFPSTITQAAVLIVLLVLSWTFVLRGHRTARMIAHNERALDRLGRNFFLVESEALDCLEEGRTLRTEGHQAGQTDFSQLHQRQVSYFEKALTADITIIENVQFRLFITGVFLAFLSIVIGVGLAQYPQAVENLSPFLFGLMKALGLAYVPGLVCIGSFMILAELVSILKAHTNRLVRQFDLAAYRVAIVGRPIEASLARSGGKGHV